MTVIRWPQGPVAGCDLETTGVNPFTDRPVQYAIVERKPDGSMKSDIEFVNPGFSIDPGATAVHGICDEDVADAMPLVTATAVIVGTLIELSAAGVPLILMNASYDLTMVDAMAREFMGHGLIELGWEPRVLDLLVLDRQYDRYRKGGRRLTDLCQHYGVAPGDSHDASADVYAAVRCVLKMAQQKAPLRTQKLDELYRLQPHWSWEQKRSLSEYRVEHGDPPLDESEFGWPIAGMAPVH